MSVAVLIVTYNRLEYTKKSLPHLLSSKSDFDLYIWDNASTDETPEYLNSGFSDPRIKEIILSKENVGQTGAMNYVWSKTKAELVGKVDNDCLPAPNWTEILAQAHQDISNLGAVACWHFRAEDFDYELAKHKIQRFGKHQIFRHPWVGGTGFLLKRKTFLEIGSWDEGPDVGTTHYFRKMALAGYINGWYYPLIYQEHMDDPVSEHTVLKNDAAIEKMYDITYTLRVQNIETMEGRMRWRRAVLHNLLCGPWEAKYYLGWRRRWRSVKSKLAQIGGVK